MFVQKSLPTSLTKMSKSETQRAVEIFDSILDWMRLTNGPSNEQRRTAITQMIQNKAPDASLRDELFLQLLKQTRGNADPVQEKNAWKLLFTIAENLPCSKARIIFYCAL